MAGVRTSCLSRVIAQMAAVLLSSALAPNAIAQRFCVLGTVPPLCHDEQGNVVPFDDPSPPSQPPPSIRQGSTVGGQEFDGSGDKGAGTTTAPLISESSLAVTLAFSNGHDCDSKITALKSVAQWVSTSATEDGAIGDVGAYCKTLYPLGSGQKFDLRSVFSVNYDFADHADCVTKISATEADAVSMQYVVQNNELQDVGSADAYCQIVPSTQTSFQTSTDSKGEPSSPSPQGTAPRKAEGAGSGNACPAGYFYGQATTCWGVCDPSPHCVPNGTPYYEPR